MVEANVMRKFFVYIMASRTGVLYTGVTNNVFRRAGQHKESASEGFAKRYRVNKLVFYEEYNNPWEAIGREKQIKAFRRQKKVALIESLNPAWLDLARDHWIGME